MVKKSFLITLCTVVAVVIFGVACSSSDGSANTTTVNRQSELPTESDSLAYIIGLSLAEQLIELDSAINFNVVCRAILERSEGQALIDWEEAKIAYLRYMLYVEPERRRGYEEQFLADLVAADRNYKRTKSGLTYNIEVIGDEKKMPKLANDWVTIRHKISKVDGTQLYPSADSLLNIENIADIPESSYLFGELPKGIVEGLRLIGSGGRINIWLPSKLGYGDEGDEELGIDPIETLYYQIEIVDVERNVGAARRQEQLNKQF